MRLLAVLDLLDEGKATPDCIPWCHELRERFTAHLIPFAKSLNDHPTNGLALCKNHHWAMDLNIIAPGTDHRWRVSPLLDARRSTGEAELLTLDGKSLLLPKDAAFHPDEGGLSWRAGRVVA